MSAVHADGNGLVLEGMRGEGEGVGGDDVREDVGGWEVG